MAKVDSWECDWCSTIDNGEHIKVCKVCSQDICEDCIEEHSVSHFHYGVDG
jgi:hypothetical protein